ncbi:MAG: DUF3761 domain-containing protein [Pseudonocardia sp.]|nr:DUF3761 domain-containing protein [Pseudonocardia sp.]
MHFPSHGRCGAIPGATAKCIDGEYGFRKHRQGTCSGHGATAQWL